MVDKELKTTNKSPNWNKDNSSPILKIMTLPIAIVMIALGIMTILGGHITPGGGFQGGAMIAGGIIFSVIIYGVDGTPLKLSHRFISALESIGALAYVLLGLVGLALTGSYLYNVGGNLYGLVPKSIEAIFRYPDLTHAGIVPYLNIAVGVKVLVGLSAIVIAFSQFKKLAEEE